VWLTVGLRVELLLAVVVELPLLVLVRVPEGGMSASD
jgi:hypothetical protein